MVVGLAIGLAVIAIVTLREESPVSYNPDDFASWISVQPDDSLFSARFPSSPQRLSQELPIANSDFSLVHTMHSASDDKGNIYQLATFMYPEPFDPEKAENILQTALDGMIEAVPGNTLLESKFYTYKEKPAMMFFIEDVNGNMHEGQMTFSDRVLYQLFVSHEPGALEDAEYGYFIDAFRIGVN